MKSRIASMKWTVGKKMYASFFSIFLVMCILAMFTTTQLRSVNQKTEEITKTWMDGVEIINHIHYLTEHVLAMELQSLLQPDRAELGAIQEQVSRTMKEIDKQFNNYEQRNISPEALDLLVKVRTAWSDYVSIHTQFVQYSSKMNLMDGAGKDKDHIAGLIRDSQNIYSLMARDLETLVQMNHDGASKAGDAADRQYKKSIAASAILLMIAALVSAALAYLMSRHISKPVRLASQAMLRLASGDLRLQAVEINNRDEIGDLARSLDEMIRSLNRIVQRIQEAADQVADSAGQLNACSEETARSSDRVAVSMQEAAKRAETQMRGSEEASKAMEEMSRGIQRVAETSGRVSELAAESTSYAGSGREQILRLIAQMNAIDESVGRSARQLLRLNERSAEIGEIVTLIREMAAQTGMLSLNASIEAARAGEHGRGFAVVAGEVKKLADRSNRSAVRIAELIAAIQAESGEAVESMNAGIDEIRSGSRSLREAGASFEDIVRTAEHLSEQIQEVAAASQQMYAGGEEVAASVAEMAHIAKMSFESTTHVAVIAKEQLAAAAEMSRETSALNETSDSLQEITAKFKL